MQETMSSTPLQLEEFTLFPKLPLEMRLKIWRETLPGPRVVRVDYDVSLQECRSSAPVPLALQVSQESRREALRLYKLSFGPRPKAKDSKAAHASDKTPEGRIYFNFDLDTFFPVSRFKDEQSQADDATAVQEPARQTSQSQDRFDRANHALERFLWITMSATHIEQIRRLALRLEVLLLCTYSHQDPDVGLSILRWFGKFSEDCAGGLVFGAENEDDYSNDKMGLLLIHPICQKVKNKTVGSTGRSDDEVEVPKTIFTKYAEQIELARQATGLSWTAAILVQTSL